MATVAGIKIKAKKKPQRNPILLDEKYTGVEPVWDTEKAEKFDDETFDHYMRQSFFYYNYFYTQKDLKKFVVEWMKSQSIYTKEQVKQFDHSGDRAIPMTVCSLIKAHKQGMPLRERHTAYITEAIARVIGKAEPEVVAATAEKVKPYAPTIQDRLNEKTAETIGELEGHFDEMLTNAKYAFKTYDFLTTNNVPQSQLGKYEEVYKERLAEITQAYEKADEQLVEGYSQYRAADFKRIIAFLTNILSDIAQYRGVKKATKKIRAPRAVSKEKQVSKLKYAKEDKPLKIVSINPADIPGSQELWVYNVKTRKIGRYVADPMGGTLGVKGTTITGFDTVKSVSKTLRKPADSLKEFAKAGKIQLRKFLDEIKATETKLNGRINADTVLLKVQ